MNRKENFTYHLSVEGETEQYYFEYLRDLINADENAVRTFVLRCDIEKNPFSYAKRKNARSVGHIAHICDYESKDDFKRCLKKISVGDVRAAVDRAEKIMADKVINGLPVTKYKKFEYYADNPALSIHKVVREILDLAYKI